MAYTIVASSFAMRARAIGLPFATDETLILGADSREVLRGPHGGVMKGNLEMPVPVARRFVVRLAARIRGARHQATIRMKMPYARKR